MFVILKTTYEKINTLEFTKKKKCIYNSKKHMSILKSNLQKSRKKRNRKFITQIRINYIMY